MTTTCSDVGSRPLRIDVAVSGRTLWDDAAAERIRGVDLSDIARKSARLRHDRPDVEVVAEIDVIIAAEVRTALALASVEEGETGGSTMLYVGTPAGLAGLIEDMYVLGIADGALLIPRAPRMADLIRDAVVPILRDRLRSLAVPLEARPA